MASERETQLIRQAMAAGITSREELANFMAQVTHESGGLTRLEEGFRYTRGIDQIPVRSAMREGPEALEAARLEALRGNPERLGDLMYGGRMGNDEPGDGYRYRGRGYMQLTGKDNYQAAGYALNLDLVNNPGLAADPENAARIATWYWQQNVPQAAREDVTAATLAVNGGTNGLEDRQSRYAEWHRTLTPEFLGTLGAAESSSVPPREEQSASPPAVEGLIRQGDRGTQVSALQEQLNRLGIRDAQGRELQIDGDFGGRTRQALEAYQRANGLEVDGIAGPRTMESLRSAQQVRAEPQPAAMAPTAPLLSDPSHPDNDLFRQAATGLEQLGPQAGFRSRQELENTAGTMVFEARVSGLTRIDHVVASNNGTGLFAVQGAMNDPAHTRVYMDRAQAATQPLEQSTRQLQEEAVQRPSPEQSPPAQTREPPRTVMV